MLRVLGTDSGYSALESTVAQFASPPSQKIGGSNPREASPAEKRDISRTQGRTKGPSERYRVTASKRIRFSIRFQSSPVKWLRAFTQTLFYFHEYGLIGIADGLFGIAGRLMVDHELEVQVRLEGEDNR